MGLSLLEGCELRNYLCSSLRRDSSLGRRTVRDRTGPGLPGEPCRNFTWRRLLRPGILEGFRPHSPERALSIWLGARFLHESISTFATQSIPGSATVGLGLEIGRTPHQHSKTGWPNPPKLLIRLYPTYVGHHHL